MQAGFVVQTKKVPCHFPLHAGKTVHSDHKCSRGTFPGVLKKKTPYISATGHAWSYITLHKVRG